MDLILINLKKLYVGYEFVAIEAISNYGDHHMAEPTMFLINVFSIDSSICTEVFFKILGLSLAIMNNYFPYDKKKILMSL